MVHIFCYSLPKSSLKVLKRSSLSTQYHTIVHIYTHYISFAVTNNLKTKRMKYTSQKTHQTFSNNLALLPRYSIASLPIPPAAGRRHTHARPRKVGRRASMIYEPARAGGPRRYQLLSVRPAA